MDLYETSIQLDELLEANRSVFIKTEPEVPDFTIAAEFKILVFGSKQKIEIIVKPENIIHLIALFDVTVFDKERIDRLYVWNLKSLASYFYSITKKFISPSTNIIDLKVIENFQNIEKNIPENLIEVVNRVKVVVSHKGWQLIYKSIHLPLSLRVLPAIESTPLLNEETKKTEHPFYVIEGQSSGRMNCLNKFAKSYLPHNMGPDVKKALKPRGYGLRFLCSDFRHCEVTVLQWLSKDETLKEILNSGADLHEKIYEIVTKDQCNNQNKRNLSKKLFLPVMYGCGSKTLAKSLGVNDTVGAELTLRIKQSFPTAWNWLQSKQEEAKKGIVYDYFQRPRTLKDNELYLARNFAVQGVAATACQEKLIALHKELNSEKAYLIFSVHDGFGLLCKTEYAQETYKLVKRICEEESILCPGLKMKVEIKFGAKLDQMKVLWKD
jgi:hypothetical protein